jgi:signal transduction histidine kinase
VIFQNVSAIKQVEAQLRDANRLKDEFLATVSHELRTPLTAIIGWAHLLRSGALDEENATRALDTIERNGRAQSQLIEDLLDVSRIISGKLRLNMRRVELALAIESGVESVRPAAQSKGVQLQTIFDPDAAPVQGDADRLGQVIWNLLANAVKFTPAGGRVEIRLQRVDSQIEIVVSDSGQGIEAAFLPHVFDRFRQADQAATREYGGLGLGLAITRHLVELHGGTISASSAGAGQGATFTVSLPAMIAHNDQSTLRAPQIMR